MTPDQLKVNLEDNLKRLVRHHEICFQGYDRAALKDLAHTLRVWMDMKQEVNDFLLKEKPIPRFKAFCVLPAITRKVRNSEHLIVCFPDEVLVKVPYSLPNGDSVQPLKYYHRPGVAHVLLAGYTLTPENTIKSKYIVAAHVKTLAPSIESSLFEFKKVTFDSWLDRSAVKLAIYLNYSDPKRKLETYDISREEIVRRVANILGGSHPEGGRELPNRNDDAVRELMKYEAVSMPLPYLILLKIAKDIIDVFAPILKVSDL